MSNEKPDWESFGKKLLKDFPELWDIEAHEIFNLAVEHKLVMPIEGGFNPEVHEDTEGVGAEIGDPWYNLNF